MLAAYGQAEDDQAGTTTAEGFLNQWKQLVSTTNWEKGRIICEWRDSLMASGASVTSYSDEAWAQLVGGVSSQHVGRLRRVFQRFGDVADQYQELYWSHFQAALDWDDAEMWLEGAIRNAFSVSQMRGKRWETLGHAGAPPISEQDETLENDEETDYADAFESTSGESNTGEQVRSVRESLSESLVEDETEPTDSVLAGSECKLESPAQVSVRQTAAGNSVDVDELPEDLTQAFEQFKLAIIAHRRTNWASTSPAVVIECLDALRELTLATAG